MPLSEQSIDELGDGDRGRIIEKKKERNEKAMCRS